MADEKEPEDCSKVEAEEEEGLENVANPRICLENVTGTVFRAHRFGIYVSFTHKEKTEIGVLFPGKAFVNGKRLLGDAVKSEEELSLLFPAGLTVYADVVSQLSRLVPESRPITGSEVEEKGDEKKCGWVIMLLWHAHLHLKPDKDSLNNGTIFTDEENAFNESLNVINELVMEEEQVENKVVNEKWFVSTILMPKPSMAISHPDSAAFKAAVGTITAIHRPHGGIIVCNGEKVFFHRSRVYLEGKHLSITVDLFSVLNPGMQVTVDYSSNETPEGEIFEDCPAAKIALLVYLGERPEVPLIRHTPFPLAQDPSKRYLVAKIVKFDPPDPTGVQSGIAEIFKPTEQNTLAFTKNSFKRYVEVDSSVRYVRFRRDVMFYLGALQHKADLQYFLSNCAFGMNIFYCYAQPMEGSAGGDCVLFKGEQVRHEVVLGWKGSVSFLHATGLGGLTLTPNTKEDTLLYPRVSSFQSTKFLGREGMDIKMYEDIVEGDVPARSVFFNGYAASLRAANEDGYVCARIHDIFPPQGNSGVSSGVVYIESGASAEKKAIFDRKACSAFGWNLEKADLQYLVGLNEPCFVKLESIPDSQDLEIRLRVCSLWIGWPKEHATYQHPRDVPVVDRHKLLLFLETHNISVKEFLNVLRGEKQPRTFIPFRKDEMKGTVVHLDRGSKFRGIGLKEQKFGRDAGAVSGVIKVDKGPLIGALVTFHRRNTWVLGYNMGKADLTNLFIEGQKVSLEAVTISTDDRKKYPGLPYQYKYRATLVWTSKFRPRNDIDKTVPESVHVNNWLRKRGLSWERFQNLVKGKLPIVPAELATRHRTNMLRGGELEALVGPLEPPSGGNQINDRSPRLDSLPVFRHGTDAVRICDEALSVSGPADPRIFRIIQNDENAQMAFHIHKALGYALDEYKKVTGRVMPANYSGFGDVFGAGPTDGGGLWMGGVPATPSGLPLNINPGIGTYQQANQMASRLQKMAMEEGTRRREEPVQQRRYVWDEAERRRGQGVRRRDDDRREEWDEGARRNEEWEVEEEGFAGGGTKRQMNNQGGNRGKKRGGWNNR